MSKGSDTRRWLQRHRSDPYVRAAQADHYRSRAVYKLAEIDEQERLLKNKRCILDLGSAPGGWSQYCARKTQTAAKNTRIIGLDRLPMEPIDGVEFIQTDFAEQEGLDLLLATLKNDPVDLVLSDMAPNLSGIKAADQAGVIYLAELALDLCEQVLTPQGDLLIKVFQGEGFDTLLKNMRQRFAKVVARKPKASRDKSREMYLLAQRWRG